MAASKSEHWLDLLDLGAIAEPSDKLSECQYFFDLASKETQVQQFRWLVSAFLSAAYSFFDICALHAYHASTDHEGEFVEDEEALAILRRYVSIDRKGKNPYRVHTAGTHEITKRLYEIRRGNTHHFPLSIMEATPNLPEGFELGNVRGQGIPALAFCRRTMDLLRQVDQELWGD